MKVQVFTIGNWLTELDLDTPVPMRLIIDICTIPPKDGVKNVFCACEPTVIAPHVRLWIIENHRHFDLVLAHDAEILKNCSNAIKFHWTNMWIKEAELPLIQVKNDKSFNVSFICGGNNMCPGHLVRRQCWTRQEEIMAPKQFFYSTRINGELKRFEGNQPLPSDSKLSAFVDSMFHITMENSQLPDYFSEKILDCFATMTVPIYLGCPNIGEYFDRNGIIVCNSVDEIIDTCNRLTVDDYYRRLGSMARNREKALKVYPHDSNTSFAGLLEPILKSRFAGKVNHLDNVQVINLAHRIDRLELAKKEMERAGLSPFTRFPAIRYFPQTHGFLDEFRKYCSIPKIRGNYDYLAGSFGCLLSHYVIIKQARDSGAEYVTIFEDDFELVDDFRAKTQKCLDALPADWNMFFFYLNHQQPGQVVNEHVMRPTKGYSTVGYIMKRALFEKVLDELVCYGKEIDVYYADVLQPLGTVYCPTVNLMNQRASHSDILGHFVKY